MSVDVLLGALFARPPLQLLTTDTVITASGTGSHSFSGGNTSYGIRWNVLLVPVEWGYEIGVLNKYESRLAQLVLEWDVGTPTVAQVYQEQEVWTDLGLFWYQEKAPARLKWSCAPGISLSLYPLILG